MPENEPDRKGPEAFLPLLKIVWFSCLFFLFLFSFYGWKFFITASDPREVPLLVTLAFYFLGVLTYAFAELTVQQKERVHPKVPHDFMRMVSYSMFEAVGLYGLLLAVLTQNFSHSLVFLLAAFAGLLRHRPSLP